MQGLLFILVLTISIGIFLIKNQVKYYFTLFLLIISVVLTSFLSFNVLFSNIPVLDIQLDIPFFQNTFQLTIDKLSAYFVLVVNLTVLIGFLYAKGYLKPYLETKNPFHFSIHYFAYLWLYISMILVVLLRDGLSFIIVWEIMALSSFLLVIFEAEKRDILKTGINYLIQMHVGMLFILTALLIVNKATGEMSFDALKVYFSNHSNWLLFSLFFIGFGIKAGFIPLHTWLPDAHPAAPSHVSGVMSGVMIKMGIYGILRVLLSVQTDLLLIGMIILVFSLISGILGVMMAIVQHDLKRLLAYHSIENIGIIGIGIGLGVIGLATNNPTLTLLGFSGGILHVLNHSLFKSLLFFNAGSVYQATHSRNIEQMGGLMRNMPKTAVLFLIGSLAICGLPPFNGFISEYLIYLGMFKSLSAANLYQSIVILGSIVGLTLIGGLAIFCFTKAFGIVFLGNPRSEAAKQAKEVSNNMISPQYLSIAFILVIGLASYLFVKPVFNMISEIFVLPESENIPDHTLSNLAKISMTGGIFILTVVFLLVYRFYHLKNKAIEIGETWGCGYTAGTFKQQYTATSYADNYIQLANPLLRTKKHSTKITEDEIFPAKKSFETHSPDVFKTSLINKPTNWFLGLLKKIAVMQTGQIQHYILYAFIFMLLLLLLTYLNLV